uniref:Calmodulin-binding domain-containing protein n=1 Tax=Fagus sylvatica TaxID=28930 RepID=A0A2N9GQB6_FAGSY
MAEGSVKLAVTPERIKPNGNKLRRNSTGKANSSNSGETVPHYLRASTGSCHDFCKYGRHTVEGKAKRPILKKVVKKPPDSQNPLVTVDLPGRKNMPVVKLKPSPDSKTHSSDTPQTIKQEVSTKSPDSQNPGDSKFLAEVKKTSGVKFKSSSYSKTHKSNNRKTTKPKVSSSSEKVEVSSKKGSSKAKDLNLSAKHATSLKPKSMTVKSMSSPNSLGGISGLRKSDIKIGKMTGASKVAVKKALASPRVSLSLNSSVNRVASSNERKHRNLKVASPLLNQNKIRKAEPKQPNNDEVQEKTLKVVSPLMNQNKIRKAEPKQPNNDEVQEKTLYVIKMETEKKPLESAQNKISAIELSHALSSSPDSSSLPNILSSSTHEEEYQEESEYTMSEAEDDSPSENNEIENIEEADTLEEGYKRRPRKSGMVCSEDKSSQPLKLKFRRGKVVDIQSANNSPRRLKFRPGKMLGENQNAKANARRRGFKRTEGGDTNGMEPGPAKVVLRHQGVKGKKDAQGLFNNVIEETASKLVETQKSKVKALVGAFETVISLQEKKPSANIFA